MILSPYSDGDPAPLARLFTASVHQLAADRYTPAQLRAWAPQPPDLERWRRRLAPLTTLVAEASGALAGFISYGADGHIVFLFTAPDFARRGVATRLCQHAELSLVADGLTEAFTEASLLARPFFQRRGYRVEAEQVVDLGGAALRRFAMRKRLTAG